VPAVNSRSSDSGGRRAPFRPRPIGPCYTCSEMGHLAASCPRSHQPYPLSQPVVSAGAEGVCNVSNMLLYGDNKNEGLLGEQVSNLRLPEVSPVDCKQSVG